MEHIMTRTLYEEHPEAGIGVLTHKTPRMEVRMLKSAPKRSLEFTAWLDLPPPDP